MCWYLASAGVGTAIFGPTLWDWGGGTEVGGSGREIVRFSPQFAAGEIVVSFGDRRLYFVTQPGQAISYPIAIPREEDRWAGVTNDNQQARRIRRGRRHRR